MRRDLSEDSASLSLAQPPQLPPPCTLIPLGLNHVEMADAEWKEREYVPELVSATVSMHARASELEVAALAKREGEAGPSLTLLHMATQQEDWDLKGPKPHAGTTGPGSRQKSSTAICPEQTSGLGPAELVPLPNNNYHGGGACYPAHVTSHLKMSYVKPSLHYSWKWWPKQEELEEVWQLLLQQQ